ncbi:jg10625 [Pararge aegeria aegeria]|uniref:tRNA (34-2'-O)-methyltransferase regulator WDR6 n=1 Tax=Pararge aegeria aegeria TaxID=348720 RepID=A0A8S4R9S0_9NEOP|nr:jg10625 [Pararge aegeria aegeria]
MAILTRTDVTAVKMYESFVIAGIGSNLEVYTRDSGNFLQKTTALRGQKIYGIVPSHFESKLLIFGGKQFTISRTKLVIINDDENLVIEDDIESILCDDWLHSGVWLSKNKVAFLTAHNVVQIWNAENQSLENHYASPDNSILYSGLLLPLQDNLLVFSGTVFSEVIIHWCGDDKPLQYLKGHKGVIFSITCDPIKKIIVTTSDDRSLRIWSVKTTLNLEYSSKNYWENADIVCMHEKYGHSARVMRNCITTDYIISIGEDSRICFWDLEGKLLRKLVSHKNACIWALDANDKYLVTGGGDSGVILHPLSLLTEYCTSEIVKIEGSVKKVEFTAKGNIVILNGNDLIYYDLKSKMNDVHKLHHKSTYKLLTLSSCKQIIAVVDKTGILAIFIENCKDEVGIKNIINKELNLGNILSMHWVGNRHLVVCSDIGDITIIASRGTDIEVFGNYTLPPCKERWLTSSSLSDNKEMLVVSDRNGRMHIYLRGNKNPVKTFYRVHGRYGATTIQIVINQIITTGRDGVIKYFSINKHTNDVKHMNSKDLDFQWVEKFLDKNVNYICGFRERVFVIYDIKNNMEILEVSCGGGHRSWDAAHYYEKIGGNFEEFIRVVYIKNSEIQLKTFRLSTMVSKNIINGTHSKEINCLETYTVNSKGKTTFYISGGEDTTLRISRSTLHSKFKDEIIFKQLSSIRTLKLLPLRDNTILLVSAGGRAQICAKIITFNEEISTSEELVNYLIKGTDKKRKQNRNWKDYSVDFDAETRIMDIEVLKNEDSNFSIITGCSDGVLRIFLLENESNIEFKMMKEIKYHETCILKTHLFKFVSKDILATTTTRGSVAFWDMEKVCTDLNPIFEMNTNKSGVNSIDIKVINDNNVLIATGGDDNAIHLNILEIKDIDLKLMKIANKWSSDAYHCSQITGLKLVNDFMVTTSIDQRITLFRLTIQSNINCKFISQTYSDIADIQGIDVISFSKNSIKVCVFGKGLEVLDISCGTQLKSK